MKPPLFRYQAPRTLKEAVVALASDPDAMVLAGGQSLLPAMNFRLANPSLLVDIQHVAELKGIRDRRRADHRQGDDPPPRTRAR
jgi:CO/xanthine dehydrogenase FAD-binding subunit